jgi:UDP-glucuronate 4-epimerase
MTISSAKSLYAATKIANEVIAQTYGNIFQLPSTGLRFFTVYGPYSRPDMAMYKFADLMYKGGVIPIYNQGKMIRDFTFVDDIVEGILRAVLKRQINKVYNLGRGSPIELMEMVRLLEENLMVKATYEMLPMLLVDIHETLADITLAKEELGYEPKTDLSKGIKSFVQWFKAFH